MKMEDLSTVRLQKLLKIGNGKKKVKDLSDCRPVCYMLKILWMELDRPEQAPGTSIYSITN